MEPKNIERLTAFSFLFIGLFMLLWFLSLSGISIPFYAVVLLIAGVVAVVTSIILFKDSGSQAGD